MELLSYNIQFGRRLPEVLNWINNLKPSPEIICFQEFPFAEIERTNDNMNGQNQIPYESAFATGIEKKGTEFGQLTLFNSQKFELINQKTIDLGISSWEKRFFRTSGQRTGLLTTLNEIDTGLNWQIVNIHLVLLALNSKRREQLKEVIKQLTNLSEDPTIVVGDFNYTSLLGNKSLFEFMSQQEFPIPTQSLLTHQFLRIRHQVDYGFSRNCQISFKPMLHLPYSDHDPVQVKIISSI